MEHRLTVGLVVMLALVGLPASAQSRFVLGMVQIAGGDFCSRV